MNFWGEDATRRSAEVRPGCFSEKPRELAERIQRGGSEGAKSSHKGTDGRSWLPLKHTM